MRAHFIEVGPRSIRRLCCGGATVARAEDEQVAFESIDDPVAIVGRQPIAAESLWQKIFESLDCGATGPVIIAHPSWWSSQRIDVVGAGAQALAGNAETRSRSWLLTQSASSGSGCATLVVEIADDFVVVVGQTMVAEARTRNLEAVAEAVALSILTMALAAAETVVIDAPATVPGAGMLAAAIAKRLRGSDGINVVRVDDIRLRRLAGELKPSGAKSWEVQRDETRWSLRRTLTSLALVVCALIGVGILHHSAPPSTDRFPATIVVEGRVAVEVPARWLKRRVVTGPGSARLQITSPADSELALHVTQSRVALTGLDATAEFLEGAIDAAPVGVFVDFNPAGRSAGRPVVTYREVRAGHDIRWTVWVDKAVRISIGCQSRSGHDEAVRRECERAVRSARALS